MFCFGEGEEERAKMGSTTDAITHGGDFWNLLKPKQNPALIIIISQCYQINAKA